MKKLTTILLVLTLVSFTSFSQTIALKLNNKSDAATLTFKRGVHATIPIFDANADLFLGIEVYTNPVFADLYCLIDSLTTPYTLLPLTDVLRFHNNTDKQNFIDFMTLNGAFVQQNDIGDVLLTMSVFNVFNIYENLFIETLEDADYVERWMELYQEGKTYQLEFPEQDTPVRNDDCD
jgi:hypothetical protein